MLARNGECEYILPLAPTHMIEDNCLMLDVFQAPCASRLHYAMLQGAVAWLLLPAVLTPVLHH